MSPAPPTRLNRSLLLGFWAVVALAIALRTMLGADRQALIADTDDAMRLAIVGDLLGGQGWYDHMQYRLNTPFGAEMHWSRLIDLPIAGLIAAFRPFFGDNAAVAAAYVWPLLLLLVLLWLSTRLTLRLVGPEGGLAALALPVLAPAVIAEFSPGRFDHHGIQILLALAMAWGTVEALRRPRWAVLAGLAAATALAIGAESVPSVAAAILCFGMLWVVVPSRADALRLFGISFALGTLGHLAVAWPPERWLDPACDAISFTYAALAACVGAAFVVLSILPLARANFVARLAAGGLMGGGILAGFLIAFPHCVAGPYAGLDPWLAQNWAAHIVESRPVWVSILAEPELTLAIVVPPLIALVVIAVRLRNPEMRGEWLIYGLFLAVNVVVTLVLLRGGRIADAVAVPALAAMIAAARAWYMARRGPAGVTVLLGSWLVSAGIAIMLMAAAVTMSLGEQETMAAKAGARTSVQSCLARESFTDLAALPPERIMAPVDLGAHLLAFTPHAVVGAPYVRGNPRDQQGVRDTFAFFNEPISEARRILDERGIGLVVICPQMAEITGLGESADDSFVRLIAEDRLPDWLAEQSIPASPLRIYSVLPRP